MTSLKDELPEIHIGTISGVTSIMSGLQTLYFEDHMPVYIANYGVRQLYTASEHLGQETPIGMRIQFHMDESLFGVIMEGFQIIGNETHVACFKCQTIISKEDKSKYATCEECGHTHCYTCESEGCSYCNFMEQYENEYEDV